MCPQLSKFHHFLPAVRTFYGCFGLFGRMTNSETDQISTPDRGVKRGRIRAAFIDSRPARRMGIGVNLFTTPARRRFIALAIDCGLSDRLM